MESKGMSEEIGMQQRPNYQQELIEVIRSTSSPKILKESVSGYHESDIAAVLDELTVGERQKLYRGLDAQTLSDIFAYVEDMGPYFPELSVRKKVDILSGMEADRAAVFLKQTGRQERDLLLDLMDDESKRDIAMIDSFDEDEIGSRMTTNYISIRFGLTVREARQELVRQAAEHDNISILYVTDENGAFYGAIGLKDLIIAREKTDLGTLITTSYPYVYAQEQISDCIDRIRDYSEDSIPILDNNNKLLGVITSQDIIEVVGDELAEDYAKFAGLAAEEDLREPVRTSMKKRLPWLVVLLGLGIAVSSVVGLFEGVVAQLTVIVCFQSLVLDMAGNVGTQSLAVTIRVLMDENLKGMQKFRLVWKEARVAFINGTILGAVSFVFVGLYLYLFKGEAVLFAFAVSGCIGAALLLSMFISGVAGTGIPILFKKAGIDPAVASGPLITTLNDLVAVVSYYGLAWLFLIQMMHLAD